MTRIYIIAGIFLFGFGSGSYVVHKFVKAKEVSELRSQLADVRKDLAEQRGKVIKRAEENQMLEHKVRDAYEQYKELLDNAPVAVGIVRMLNVSIDQTYSDRPLVTDNPTSPSTVTGGDIAIKLKECELDYNKARLQIGRLGEDLQPYLAVE